MDKELIERLVRHLDSIAIKLDYLEILIRNYQK